MYESQPKLEVLHRNLYHTFFVELNVQLIRQGFQKSELLPIEMPMTTDEYKQIFAAEKQSFLEKGLESSELKNFLINFIVEMEKKCEFEFQTTRARISAAMSLLDDDESRIKVSKRLKESKISYSGTNDNLSNDRPLSSKSKTEKTKTNAWKTAVLACKKLPGFDANKIHGVLKSKYPNLTIEMIEEVLK